MEESTSTLGLEWLGHALAKDKTVVTSTKNQLLTKLSAPKKELSSKIIRAVDSKFLLTQFLSDSGVDVLDRSILSFLIDLACTVPKDELKQLLSSSNFLETLKTVRLPL